MDSDTHSATSEHKYEPGFAIMRVQFDQLLIPDPENEEELDLFCAGDPSVIRVLWSRERALEEVSRLNALNGEKGAYYHCRHTRVETRRG